MPNKLTAATLNTITRSLNAEETEGDGASLCLPVGTVMMASLTGDILEGGIRMRIGTGSSGEISRLKRMSTTISSNFSSGLLSIHMDYMSRTEETGTRRSSGKGTGREIRGRETSRLGRGSI